MEFDPKHPIVLGLVGKAGTGKSSIASIVSPPATFSPNVLNKDEDWYPIWWSHQILKLPLRRLLTARTQIQGTMASDRMKYEILNTLLDVFGNSPIYGAPSLEALYDLILQISHFPISEGKPRAFMQSCSDAIQKHKPDALSMAMKRRINQAHRMFNHDTQAAILDLEEDNPDMAYEGKHYGVLVSDVRLLSQGLDILKMPNGFLVKLECDEDVRIERLVERDGTVSNLDHKTETEIDEFEPEMFSLIIDTTSEIERMLLDGSELPTIESDFKKGVGQANRRCVNRLRQGAIVESAQGILDLGRMFVDGQFTPEDYPYDDKEYNDAADF